MYNLVVIDLPLSYKSYTKDGIPTRKLVEDYKVMNKKEIFNIREPLLKVMDKKSIMCLWTTGAFMDYSLEFISHMGYKFSGIIFDWVKTTKDGSVHPGGLGRTTMRNVEYVILARRNGGITIKKKGISATIVSPRLSHSQKPEEMQNRLETIYGEFHGLELFARRIRKPLYDKIDWECIGDEISGNDIVVDLEGLYNSGNPNS